MTIRIKADPANKRIFFGLDRITATHKKAIRHAAFDIGREMQKDTRNSITSGKKTGRISKIKGRVHQASAPGEAPADLSGDLQKSVDYDVRSYKQVEFGYTINYGEYLEEGVKDDMGNFRLAKRPNIVTVANNSVQKFINYMAAHYKRLSK
ncbi:MAG: hypothetical protein ACUZ8E_17490 [Candidatus Anammoxibacter sp.]